MRNELYVNFRQCEVPFRLDVVVDGLAADLGRWFAKLTHCTVTVDLRRTAHGSDPRFTVVVELPMPEQPLAIRVTAHGKPGDGLLGVLQVAFASAARELRRAAARPPSHVEPLATPARRPVQLRDGEPRALPLRVAARRNMGLWPPFAPTGGRTELGR